MTMLGDRQQLSYIASQAADARLNLELETEGMTLNIGPQHPATHGTLRGHVCADLILDVARGPRVVGRKVSVGRRPGRNPVEWHGGVAVGSGHSLVDLSEYDSCRINGRPCRVDTRAERAGAVTVRRRELYERRIKLHSAAGEEMRNVGEKDRHEVGATLGDRFAEAGAREQRDRAEAASVLGSREGQGPLEVNMPEFYAAEVGPPG